MDLIKCFGLIAPSKLRKLILECVVKYLKCNEITKYEESQMWSFCANLLATYSEASNTTMHPNEIRELFYKEILPSLGNMNYGYDEQIIDKLKNMGKKTFIKVTENLITDDEQSENDEQQILSEEQVLFNESQFENFSENINGDPLNLSSNKNNQNTVVLKSNNEIKENRSSVVPSTSNTFTDINDVVISNTNEEFLIHSLWQQANLTGSQINQELYDTKLTSFECSNQQSLPYSDNTVVVLHPSENIYSLQKSNNSNKNANPSLESNEEERFVIDESKIDIVSENIKQIKTSTTKKVVGKTKKLTNKSQKKRSLSFQKNKIPSHIGRKSSSNVKNLDAISKIITNERNINRPSASIRVEIKKVINKELIDLMPLLLKNQSKVQNFQKSKFSKGKQNMITNENTVKHVSRMRTCNINEIKNWPMVDSESEAEDNENKLPEAEQTSHLSPSVEKFSNSQNSFNSHIDEVAQEKIEKFFETMPKEYLFSKDDQINNKNDQSSKIDDSREILSRLLSPISNNNEKTQAMVDQVNSFISPKKKKFTTCTNKMNNFSQLLALRLSPITKPKKKQICNDFLMADSSDSDEEVVKQSFKIKKKFTTTPSKTNSKLSDVHAFPEIIKGNKIRIEDIPLADSDSDEEKLLKEVIESNRNLTENYNRSHKNVNFGRRLLKL